MIVDFASILLVAVQTTGPSSVDWREEAYRLAENGQFDAALESLAGQPDAGSYELRVMQARLLSWSGRHADAERAITALSAEYPDNPEILALRGALAYYRGELEAADRDLQRALVLSPASADARDLLERVAAARQAEAGRSRLRLDAGVELSTFSRSANTGWQSAFAQITRIGPGYAIGLRREEYDRFGLRNAVTGVRASYAFMPQWTVDAQADYGPDNVYRPESSLGVSLTRRWSGGSNGGSAWRVSAGIRRDRYVLADIDEAYAELAGSRGRYALTARAIGIHDPDSGTAGGGLVRGERTFENGLTVSLGYADAPETVASETIRTRSVFGGLRYQVSTSSQIRVDCVRDDREAAYIRKACSVSFSRTF